MLQAKPDTAGDPQPGQQAPLLEDDADLLVRGCERPQAACSNRRYIYPLGRPMTGVNEKISTDLGQEDRMIIYLDVRAKTISPIGTTLRRAQAGDTEVVLGYPVPTC
jgi:hypothetical protein